MELLSEINVDWKTRIKGLVGTIVELEIQDITHTVVGDMDDEGEVSYKEAGNSRRNRLHLDAVQFRGETLLSIMATSSQGESEIIPGRGDLKVLNHQPGWCLLTQYPQITKIYSQSGEEINIPY
jgi:hypothetical protein